MAFSTNYLVVVGVIVALVFLPALLVGGGFLVALVLGAIVVAVLLGGPLGYDIYRNKTMGERGGMDVRNVIQGDGPNDRGPGGP